MREEERKKTDAAIRTCIGVLGEKERGRKREREGGRRERHDKGG